MTDDKVKKEEKNDSKVSKSVEKLVDEVAKLSVMELSELVNALQNKLGVTAAAPVVAGSVPAASAASEEGATTDQTTSGGGNLVMTAAGDNKIGVIKALREINQNWTLKEAKDMTEQLPTEVLKDAKPDDVKSAAEKLKAAGATVEVK